MQVQPNNYIVNISLCHRRLLQVYLRFMQLQMLHAVQRYRWESKFLRSLPHHVEFHMLTDTLVTAFCIVLEGLTTQVDISSTLTSISCRSQALGCQECSARLTLFRKEPSHICKAEAVELSEMFLLLSSVCLCKAKRVTSLYSSVMFYIQVINSLFFLSKARTPDRFMLFCYRVWYRQPENFHAG